MNNVNNDVKLVIETSSSSLPLPLLEGNNRMNNVVNNDDRLIIEASSSSLPSEDRLIIEASSSSLSSSSSSSSLSSSSLPSEGNNIMNNVNNDDKLLIDSSSLPLQDKLLIETSSPLSSSSPQEDSKKSNNNDNNNIRSLYYLSPDEKDNSLFTNYQDIDRKDQTIDDYYKSNDTQLSPLHEDNDNNSTNSNTNNNNYNLTSSNSPDFRTLNDDILDDSNESSYLLEQNIINEANNEAIELKKVLEESMKALEKAFIDIRIIESKLEIEVATTKQLREQINDKKIKEKTIKEEYEMKLDDINKKLELEIQCTVQLRENIDINETKLKTISIEYEQKLTNLTKNLANKEHTNIQLREQITLHEIETHGNKEKYSNLFIEYEKSKEDYENQITHLKNSNNDMISANELNNNVLNKIIESREKDIIDLKLKHDNDIKKHESISYELQNEIKGIYYLLLLLLSILLSILL